MDALTTAKAHRQFAAEAFNQCWELMDLPERTAEKNREMIRLAEASCWHWQCTPDRTPQNDAISYWQLSRVYALCGNATTAIYYGNLGAHTVKQHSLNPFHIGYAWESLARAYSLAGMHLKAREAMTKAQAAANRVKDPADKAALEMDLININIVDETAGSAKA